MTRVMSHVTRDQNQFNRKWERIDLCDNGTRACMRIRPTVKNDRGACWQVQVTDMNKSDEGINHSQGSEGREIHG